MDNKARIVDDTPPVSRAVGFAAVMQSIPQMVWAFAITLLSLLIVISLWFHYRDLEGFTGELLTWTGRALVVLAVLIGVRIAWTWIQIGHDAYHKTMVAREDRRTARAIADKTELQVETLRLKNRQLAAKLELDPMIIQYALAQGHNIDYTKDGALKVTNYLSNMQTMFPANPPAPAQIDGPKLGVKTFAELLADGTIQAAIQREQIIHGYVDGVLLYGDWLDIYSCSFGGVSGSGKSTTVRMYIFQALLYKDSSLVMIDPHIHEPNESLAYEFIQFKDRHLLPPCDDKIPAVKKRIAYMSQEYARRKANGIIGPMIFFVIDEFNELMRIEEIRDDMTKLLLDIAQGGRKFGMRAFLIGQRWSDQDLGGQGHGAQIRSSLSAKQGHQFTDEDQAKRLMGTKYGPLCLELETGYRYFKSSKGPTYHIQTPLTLSSDGAIIRELLGEGDTNSATFIGEMDASSATSEGAQPLRLVPPSTSMDVSEDAARDATTEPLSYRAQRVLELVKAQRGQNEIIEELWGKKSTDGRPYRAAVEEYRAILAQIVGQLGA